MSIITCSSCSAQIDTDTDESYLNSSGDHLCEHCYEPEPECTCTFILAMDARDPEDGTTIPDPDCPIHGYDPDTIRNLRVDR